MLSLIDLPQDTGTAVHARHDPCLAFVTGTGGLSLYGGQDYTPHRLGQTVHTPTCKQSGPQKTGLFKLVANIEKIP